uniref:Uncharacterized protein n=1 Tax=Arundo donax TaxID=35708 RepID=A0A0A8Y7Y6_ARUDO
MSAALISRLCFISSTEQSSKERTAGARAGWGRAGHEAGRGVTAGGRGGRCDVAELRRAWP